MGRISVRHTETAVRAWQCAHCGASAEVMVSAIGQSGSRAYFFNKQAVANELGEAAAEDANRDAKKILGLIACPSCMRRAPSAVFWSVFRLTVAVVGFGALASFLAYGLTRAEHWPWIVTPLALLLAIWIGTLDERRRWLEARRATPRSARKGELAKPLPRAVARTAPQPVVPIIPVVTAAPEIIAPASADDGPRFLKPS